MDRGAVGVAEDGGHHGDGSENVVERQEQQESLGVLGAAGLAAAAHLRRATEGVLHFPAELAQHAVPSEGRRDLGEEGCR